MYLPMYINTYTHNKHLEYNGIVKSITTYSSEVWQLKERIIRSLEATEMTSGEESWENQESKNTQQDNSKNDEGEPLNKDDIKTKQLKWYGHA